jgi:hypothetical protein
MTDERSDDRPASAGTSDELIARTLAEVRAARAAILQAFDRERRRGVDWTEASDDPKADAPGDGQ